jgi:hypothetical protein
MDDKFIRLLITGVLFVHGVGHTLGFFVPTGIKLFSNLNEKTARTISSVFWVLSFVGFLAALLGFWGVLVPAEWWRGIAVGTAVISMMGLVLFGHNWGALNRYGAWGVNIAILVTQLWLQWPPDQMLD